MLACGCARQACQIAATVTAAIAQTIDATDMIIGYLSLINYG